MGLIKLAGPFRVDTFTGQVGIDYPLTSRPLGENAGRAQFQVVVLAQSTSFQVGVLLYHGPSPENVLLHSTPIAVQVAVASGPSFMVSGEADAAIPLGAWLRPVIRTDSGNTSAQWAVIEVYMLTKRR